MIEIVKTRRATKSVLTIATGKPVYLKMALTLARSFIRWNGLTDIAFFIVTDRPVKLPGDLGAVNIVQVKPGQLGSGFEPKLHLDEIAPTDQTLFIDSDCLCLGDLTGVFERFRGRSVSVVGGSISEGEWFGNVGNVCAHFGVSSLPKFNGGVYYLERGGKAAAVYGRARDLVKHYDALGLRRLRGSPNDELLMAVAMALEDCDALPDDGSIIGDLFSCPHIGEIDVIGGIGRISNPPSGQVSHRDWYPVGEISPSIIHFLGDFTSHRCYRAADITLTLAQRFRIPVRIADPLVRAFYGIPAAIWEQTKFALRPLYHQIFGARKITRSERI